MRSGTRSLSVLFLLSAACSQIIGLGDYDKTDDPEGSGGESSSGGPNGGANAKGGSGGMNRGGTSVGEGGNDTGSGGEAGSGTGGSGDAGQPGAGGRVTSGGRASGGGTSGGSIGTAGEGGASTDAGAGGSGGDGGTLTSGGTPGKGGTAGKGGTTSGGKSSSGGTSGGSAGKGGSGGTSGGTAGKGGSGGTSGGKGGSGGSGGKSCTTAELIEPDGNFDLYSGEWIETPTPPPLVCTTTCAVSPGSIAPQSGQYFAWMGGTDDEVQTLSRPFSLPANTRSVTLDCYFWTQTDETEDVAYDTLAIELMDNTGTVVVSLGEIDNTQASTGWARLQYPAQATAFVGTPTQLVFTASLDVDNTTNFLIDTCSLRATVCN